MSKNPNSAKAASRGTADDVTKLTLGQTLVVKQPNLNSARAKAHRLANLAGLRIATSVTGRGLEIWRTA